MDFLFEKRKTPAEILRQHQRGLTKAQREIDRERTKLEAQEKKLINDIKKSAKLGQISASRIMAKDLVRTRNHIQKFYQMKTQLQAVSLRIQMAEAMKGASKAIMSINRRTNLPGIQKVMMDFNKESEVMDMKEEMMNDAIDDAMDDENQEQEEDDIVNQVLDEIGVNLNQALANTPDNIGSSKNAEIDDDAALQARLDNLRRE